MTREVIYHLLEEAAESGRHYQASLMAARRTVSAHGGRTEFNILGDALMEADNAIAAIEEMQGCRTTATDCLDEAEEFLAALRELRSKADTLVLDAAAIAQNNGNPKGMNIVLLGALIQALGLQDIDWATALRANVKRQFADVNLRCLDAGMHASEAVAG